MGGIALNLTPPRYGSSGLSKLRNAFPPRGCLLLRVRSCRVIHRGVGVVEHGTPRHERAVVVMAAHRGGEPGEASVACSYISRLVFEKRRM